MSFILELRYERGAGVFKLEIPQEPLSVKTKNPVTIRLGEEVIDYFELMAVETNIPCQSLTDCDALPRRLRCRVSNGLV